MHKYNFKTIVSNSKPTRPHRWYFQPLEDFCEGFKEIGIDAKLVYLHSADNLIQYKIVLTNKDTTKDLLFFNAGEAELIMNSREYIKFQISCSNEEELYDFLNDFMKTHSQQDVMKTFLF